MEERKVYMHEGQLRYCLVSANSSVNICSRRWGKSYIVAARIHENVLEMPGSLGVFVASSFRQAHSRTLPSALMALDDLFGWKRDVHYVVGKRPSKALGFLDPIFQPSDLKDVVWFYNGTLMVVVSQEVTLSANSLTIHWLVADEAKGLNEQRLSDEILPALGGSRRHFGDAAKYPHAWGQHYFTDMPTAKEGLWLVRRFKDREDRPLYDDMWAEAVAIARLEQNGGTPYYIEQKRRALNLRRAEAFYYQQRPIYDNWKVVGLDYIARCKRDLPNLVYRTSMLCQPPDKIDRLFYESFDPARHTYEATDNARLSGDYTEQHYDSLFDTDCDPKKPLAISFDYGKLINWVVVAQVDGNVHRTLKSIFTKDQRRLRDLIGLFCDYYAPHANKTVMYYYDATALPQGYVEYGHSAYDIVHEEMRKRGWTVVDMYLSTPMRHERKFGHVNEGFKGKEALLPMLNRENNRDLIQALQFAQLVIGSKGIQKDKSGEKTPESDTTLPLEWRTDATDAWDTNYLGCLMKPYATMGFVWV